MTTMEKSRSTGVERDKRIDDNLPLVRYCVNSMNLLNAHSGLQFEDLVALGTLGLVQAADRFDDSRGVKFSNYAMVRIRGAVIDGLRSMDPVGRSTRNSMRKISEKTNALAFELGRTPTAPEVCGATGLTEAEYWSAQRVAGRFVVSIDTPGDDGSVLSDRLSDGAPDISSAIERRELTAALTRAIALLPARDRLVLQLYYVERLSLRGVGLAMDLSETRVSQLMHRAYSRLRADRGLSEAA
jgi:RNA polymerase sigma factor for flagellar operon FliA